MPLVTTSDTRFELRQGESLLDALERTNHAVEYQCRSGYCGSCRLRLVSGCVSYPQPPLAFVAQGEILSCCCRVDSDIEIECCLNAPR